MPSKTKTMIVFRSRTMHPQSPALTIGGTVLKESEDLAILGVTLYPVPYVPVWATLGAVISHRFTAEPRSIDGLLFPYQYLCGTILVTPCLMVSDRRVSRAGPMPFYWPKLLAHFLSPTVFPFSSFILWVGVVGLGSPD